MNRTTFSDDTTSGRWSTGLRGLRRVTVVARAEDPQGFEWLAWFKRDFLPEGAEAKSTTVLPIMDVQPSQAKELVLSSIAGYPVFSVDLYEFYRRVLGELVARLRPLIPQGLDPYDFTLRLLERKPEAHVSLRQIAVGGSALGRLEGLLESCVGPPEDVGFDAGARSRIELADRPTLAQMDNRQFAAFLARLGAAIGDSLDPGRQAAVLEKCLEGQFIFNAGHYACQLLAFDVQTDKIYDVGPVPVREQLEEADDRIWNFVQQQVTSGFFESARRGVLDEQASHTQLGLQAADIAAAIASREYESAPDRRRVEAVKRVFGRVFFNGRWV